MCQDGSRCGAHLPDTCTRLLLNTNTLPFLSGAIFASGATVDIAGNTFFHNNSDDRTEFSGGGESRQIQTGVQIISKDEKKSGYTRPSSSEQ